MSLFADMHDLQNICGPLTASVGDVNIEGPDAFRGALHAFFREIYEQPQFPLLHRKPDI